MNEQLPQNQAPLHAKRFYLAMHLVRCPRPNFLLTDFRDKWPSLKGHDLTSVVLNRIARLKSSTLLHILLMPQIHKAASQPCHQVCVCVAANPVLLIEVYIVLVLLLPGLPLWTPPLPPAPCGRSCLGQLFHAPSKMHHSIQDQTFKPYHKPSRGQTQQ